MRSTVYIIIVLSLLLTLGELQAVANDIHAELTVGSPCACTTVNEAMIWKLNELDVLINNYAAVHSGQFPTYREFLILAERSQPDVWAYYHATPNVNMVGRTFPFAPTLDDVWKIGYAISQDGKEYILLGIGHNEIYETSFTVTWRLGRGTPKSNEEVVEVKWRWWYKIKTRHSDYVRDEFPILSPGDNPSVFASPMA